MVDKINMKTGLDNTPGILVNAPETQTVTQPTSSGSQPGGFNVDPTTLIPKEKAWDWLAGTFSGKSLPASSYALANASMTGAEAGTAVGLNTTAASPGILASLPTAGALAFGAWTASKILEGFTNDNPHISFQGNKIKYGTRTKGINRDEKPYTTVGENNPNHGGHKSKAGFEYAISAKDFKGAKEVANMTRDYLDDAFTRIQSQTDVDLNKIIPYAFEGTNLKEGESPQVMADRVIEKVMGSVSSGNPYNPEGKYITGVEQKNHLMDNSKEDTRAGTRKLTHDDIARDYSGKGYYKAPVYSDVPVFEGSGQTFGDIMSNMGAGEVSIPKIKSVKAR